MELNDEYVLKYLSKWKYVPWNRIDNNIKEYLLNRFDEYTHWDDEKKILKENYFRLLNNIESLPKCPICGDYCVSRIYSYGICCNKQSCRGKVQHKTYLKTLKEKYGEEYVNTTQIKEFKEKIKQTCLEKYGATSPLGNKDIWNKTRENTIKHFGCAYNKEKLNKTMMEKYGVKWFTQSKELKEINKANEKERVQKCDITKRKNNSFNTSKIEQQIYNILLTKFKEDDIIKNYKSDLYPFKCDFYIKSLNIYIEYQGIWTHGGKPYNKDDEQCKLQYDIWFQKSQTSKFYKGALYNWTVRDVKKRNIARENNLNWIEFFNFNDFLNWFNTL